MELDIGNALATVADPGVDRETLDELNLAVEAAHQRIAAGIESNEQGYAALGLPDQTDPDTIYEATAQLPKASHIILIGIGGSALGAKTIIDACETETQVHVLDNIDAPTVRTLFTSVPPEETVVHVVSKSGKTTETIANAVTVIGAFQEAGVDWRERILVSTGSDGPLADFATNHSLPQLMVPDKVPGRFAALSSVGLPVPAMAGVDITSILDGGKAAVDALQPDLFESAAYAFGATSYQLATEGVTVNAMMPYAERLETFAEWFAQLWAESLGKDGVGQVPARALGVTDQHSQLQLYRAGPATTQVTFLTLADGPNWTIPAPAIELGQSLNGLTFNELIEAEQRGTEASLAEAGRPNVRFTLDSIDERSLGELLVTMEAACIMAGELFEINTFEQPAVEWGKRATRALLAGKETTETAAIADKETLTVPSE